ncbi:MAG: nucleotidyl transferase AbiEii/AbiGii toxin family protein [Methylococcaceae bacterium]|nr:nucleotidyl transferase AbiEii/AbiGii toxin family protein [Methylococcaceae bacterium]
MSGYFQPRLDTLPTAQQRLWPQLSPLASLGFVLYGGTAIALRLGHRTSVDFDFFSERSLDAKSLRAALPFLKQATVLQEQADNLTVLVEMADASSPVKLSFFGGIDFGRVGQPQYTQDGVLLVAALDDLLATKLKVILQRIEAKDYRDIAAIIAAGLPLGSGLSAAKALFGPAFPPSESLKALVYFQGGDLASLAAEEKRLLVEAAKTVENLPRIDKVSGKLSDD